MTVEFHLYLMADGILNIIDGLVKLLSLGFYQTNLSIRWTFWYSKMDCERSKKS